jgi:hypothetical protein
MTSPALRPTVAASLLMAALMSPAMAQSITVQSGEHADFTRLVLEIGPDRAWEITGEPERPEIRFDPPVAEFDVSQVFSVIPRTRLSGLQTDGGLVLDLACACPVTASRFRNRYLVLDIADGPVLPTADLPVTEPGVRQETDEADASAARRLAAAEALPGLTRLILDPSSRVAQPDPPVPVAADEPALETAAMVMAEQLARAAASGLIDPAPGRPLGDADPTVLPLSDNGSATAPSPSARGIDEVPFALPLRAETAVDLALQPAPSPEPQRPNLACTGREMDMTTWSDGRGLGPGLGALRLALYDERDTLQPPGVIALARHYLYHGFGAEARFWLLQLPTPPTDLVALSHLVDGDLGPVFPAERDAAFCSPNELLWRFLDGQAPDPLSRAHLGQIQRATAALPLPLRDHLGPAIARHLHDGGHASPARNIRDMLALSGRLSPSAMLRLDLDLGIPHPDGAEGTRTALATALRDDQTDAPAAMAHALRFDRETGQPVSETRLVAAEALLREVGIGATTQDLWTEVVLALAQRGDMDGLLPYLSGPAPGDVALDRALTGVFGARLAEEDAAGLLLLARMYGPRWTATGSEAGRTRVAVIAFLRERGFADAAEAVRGAQRMLILPARPAAQADAQDAARMAWISENWLQLAGLTIGAHHDLAERMLATAEEVSPPALDDLSALSTRLSDTQALRQTLSTVLADPTPRFRMDDAP